MAHLSSSLLLFLVPTLQSITTSSGSSLSTRWRGSSLLSPSPSLEQKRRVVTSPSPCEYGTASHQAHFASRLCTVCSVCSRFETYNMQLGFQLYKEKKTSWRDQLTHMETTQAVAWKRTINGDDGVNNLLKALFPDNRVILHVLCIKEP